MKPTENNLWPRLRAACAEGPIPYRDYIELALYAEGAGYYSRPRQRVGRSAERDFYTAESLGPVFARLVATAAADLLGESVAARSTFCEIAAEPGMELVRQLDTHPFRDSRVIRQGEPITVDGPSVIFANEWLDALPFHRLRFENGRWRERGVALKADGSLEEVLLESFSPPVAKAADRLPRESDEGYELDLPLAAEAAVADLLAQDWNGLLLLFDYGKSWQSLAEDCPAGTARTYYRHRQENDLLDRPGEKDITCDLCWDPLLQQARDAGLKEVTLESQESFLVRRAARAAEAIVTEAGPDFSRERQTLMELIHPAHMGRRFQVLWALRGV